ncbi:hypothetical protein EZV62_002486 [Acer yangbiense]|uniref:NB-ARC domain-containing protein n=1 Tax=Acer yangbiense TaxID=1000413 RepID=A0A5C7IXA2_9ROSI|nr:hypothetical protein EZV62_002486 [Acer yangbiense]
MVDVVISIAAKVAELMVVPIGKHICYPFKYSSKMDELKKQVEKLTDVREMLQHSVDEAKTQGDEIEEVVEKWLTKVDEFTKGVVKPIIDDQDKAGKLCSIGFCPNLMARYSLSKKAAKTTKVGLDLLGEGKFEKVSYRPLLRKTISTYIRDDYEEFESRKPIFQEIMQALKDDNFKMIEVYGMGGVGKTTLVERVVGQAIEDKLFDFEITVDITETPDIKKIQDLIAEELGLKFDEEGLSRRAVRLRHRLKKEKKVLIVLDNIWAKLDLEAVGIPFSHEEEKGSSSLQEEDRKGRNDDQRRCKILLTSRSEYVLRNDMNAEKNFLVEILSEEEAGNLFWKIVGDAVKNCDFEAIGVEIIRYCAGLPVAIATIARRNRLHTLINHLKASCLLLDGNKDESVKMHDIIHTVAVSIASTYKLMFNIQDVTDIKEMLEKKLPKDSTAISLYHKDISMLPERTEDLYLDELKGVKNVLYQLNGEGFPKLKHLHVQNDPEIQYIVNSIGWGLCLENLKLSSINIECMWLDQLPAISSSCQTLISLTVEECSGNLKFLFSYSMVKSLVQLEILEIRNFEFHSLTQLSIEDCPKLKTFSHALASADIKQSNEIEQMNCQYDIHPLFGETVVLPTLASMNLSSICIQTVWLNHLQSISSSFQNLTEIVMDGCGTLKHVYSSSMVESLIQLKNLEISNCKLMEAVIITQGERTSNTLFPKLYRLRLKHLPKLTSFCNFEGKSIELPSLNHLWLGNCPKMQAFVSNSPDADNPTNKEEQVNSEQSANIQPLFDEKEIFKELKISSCMMEEIVAKEDVEAVPYRFVFPQLKLLQLVDLPSLRSFYSGVHISEWPKLKKLRMWGCNKVEILTSEFLSLQKSHGESQLENSIQEPLIIDDKV